MTAPRILPATMQDVARIADLHAHSWQTTYAHMLPAEHMRDHLIQEHTALWRERLTRVDDTAMRIWKACPDVANAPLAGFVCALSGGDGILLDNLHVAAAWQGQGIGRALFYQVRDWASAVDPKAALYLWVLARNTRARHFYDRLGGRAGAVHPIAVSPGIELPALRYVWQPETTGSRA
ncbi:GNAT family N-acetyltransferase [Pandoraea bronchicola]|uniref:N-acetyltransferase, (GNAT) family protein n=1 Tax=Pandoraea bronchicola TaxID=2508287 RepID=A0A5E5BRV8_9BURK|nr:GNAT family N-acetyltransferase [Pandoraea bronchicola]VVE88056.1 N-acetyltransferase, (GNAT) family protein [Pandoraea bronchicola]